MQRLVLSLAVVALVVLVVVPVSTLAGVVAPTGCPLIVPGTDTYIKGTQTGTGNTATTSFTVACTADSNGCNYLSTTTLATCTKTTVPASPAGTAQCSSTTAYQTCKNGLVVTTSCSMGQKCFPKGTAGTAVECKYSFTSPPALPVTPLICAAVTTYAWIGPTAPVCQIQSSNCLMSDWTVVPESTCSALCNGGVLPESRTQVTPQCGTGAACLDTSTTRNTLPCNTDACPLVTTPVDGCTFGPWTPVGSCSALCDGGMQTEYRVVTQFPTDCSTCGDFIRTVPCNTQACPYCEDPPMITNGIVTVTKDVGRGEVTWVFSCNAGFVLSGHDKFVCHSQNGDVTPNQAFPTCVSAP